MNWSDARTAIEDAGKTMSALDNIADKMADMLHGRLRKVSKDNLKKLKRELEDFNSTTKRWKR